MHDSVARSLQDWADKYRRFLEKAAVADIGAYNINGSTKQVLAKSPCASITGFDILAGDGVDVVIQPGEIPEEYHGQYDVVTSISSFQCCPDSDVYRQQIIDLIKPGGMLFLTMCSTECKSKHSSSPNEHYEGDYVRMSREQLIKFFSRDFEMLKCYESHAYHPDLVYIAQRRERQPVFVFQPKLENIDQIVSDIRCSLEIGWPGLGPVTEKFEKAFAQYIGVKHCVATNSCTAALHLAVKTLGLKRGAKVLTTPITFAATNQAILYEGLTPVFCDVEPRTGNMDPELVADAIKKHKIQAIMTVHLGGYSCEMSLINEIAQQYGIPIIEDCAHAAGADYNFRKVGDTDNTCCWSFHAVKNCPAGDGGAVTTNDDELAERLRRLRWHGIDKDTITRAGKGGYKWEYDITETGFKYHMNDISAHVALNSLQCLDVHNERRRRVAETYVDRIPGAAPMYYNNRKPSYHFIPLFFKKRKQVYEALLAEEIFPGMHYKPNYKYKPFAKYPRVNKCKGAEEYGKTQLTLPIHLKLSNSDLDVICSTINEVL
jgi:dTDP-4-amino-4,6-dideoxygalactose transaminase